MLPKLHLRRGAWFCYWSKALVVKSIVLIMFAWYPRSRSLVSTLACVCHMGQGQHIAGIAGLYKSSRQGRRKLATWQRWLQPVHPSFHICLKLQPWCLAAHKNYNCDCLLSCGSLHDWWASSHVCSTLPEYDCTRFYCRRRFDGRLQVFETLLSGIGLIMRFLWHCWALQVMLRNKSFDARQLAVIAEKICFTLDVYFSHYQGGLTE